MKLFLGLIFILLDFQITVGTAVIGVLPDFIGFWLVMKAMEAREDDWRHLAFGLTLGSLVLFIADLVAKDAMTQVVFWCAGLAAEVLMLLLLRRIIRRLGDENRLRELFPVLAGIRLVCCLLGWVPLVGAVCTVAMAVVSVCFLAAAYRPMVKG